MNMLNNNLVPLDTFEKIVVSKNSYLYNEPSHTEIQESLDKMIDLDYEYPSIIGMETIDPSAIPIEVARMSANLITTQSTLAENGYKLRRHEITEAKRTQKRDCLYYTMYICLHKPSCAFGKVVLIQIFHDDKGPHVVFAKLKGVLSEDHIEFTGLYPSYSRISSLSASASISASTSMMS